MTGAAIRSWYRTEEKRQKQIEKKNSIERQGEQPKTQKPGTH